MVIVWDYKEGTMMGSYETHKVCVEDVCFTCNSDFLVSLGGRDDGHVIVWDVQKNSLTCGILSVVFKIFFFVKSIQIRSCKSKSRKYIRFGETGSLILGSFPTRSFTMCGIVSIIRIQVDVILCKK